MFRLTIVVVTLAFSTLCIASPGSQASAAEPAFAGSEACRSCHEREFEEWTNSHHQLAMQAASEETVLGDFNDASVDYFGSTSFMFRKGERYLMRTGNAAGEMQEFEISYTFGVEPLQQYLTDFPDGRKQVLPFAWDTRPEDEGGQRWFHLYPETEIRHDDDLHWTGRNFNWNYMCAECHSTNLRQNYDLESDTFRTTYAEVSVGCEACHGPGSRHVAQARSEFDADFGLPVGLDDRRDAFWIMNARTGIAERSAPAGELQQPESCGRCHARRSVLIENYDYGKPLLDTHRPALLDEGLYHADGRILDEVYVYGSFVQSKMYAAGVTCTDCHNPHTAELRAGPNPNETCAQCHATEKFAAATHAPGADCVSCHMAEKTYMGVDGRRDHSFRLPGTSSDPSHYGAAIQEARASGADPAAALNTEFPPIARATLITMLKAPFDAKEIAVLDHATNDANALVRMAAMQAIHSAPPTQRPLIGTGLLADPVRAVRVQAALAFAGIRHQLPPDAARSFASAASEYRQSLVTAASRPESLTMLSDFEFRLGDNARSIESVRHALRLDPGNATARHAHGLALIREKDYDEALVELQRAYSLGPDNPRFAYVYAVALNSMGQQDEALRIAELARDRFPSDDDLRNLWQSLQR